MKKIYLATFIVLFVAALGYGGFLLSKHGTVQTGTNSSTIHIVAAENFYGNIAKQLGGSHVQILSILSDPNADPHEYESSVQDAIAVANANIVIENGDGYDTWMDKLLSASPNKNRTVLVGATIANHKLADNPHVWYGIDNVQTIAGKITNVLKRADPADANEYDQNLTKFNKSLQPIQQKMNAIKTGYHGTPVGLTETIYLYQTQAMGLTVLTPLSFERTIAEGNDPSADGVAKANNQITNKQVKILIYNEQTITPITTNLQNEAKPHNIPIVPVNETMPQNKSYQSWMLSQLTDLQNALQSSK